ncbi:MAG: ABC transporter permease, partial [Actinobacteria bacterium]|nr:ABC transporter permease [Actinomycetota bacterium]
LVVFLGIRAVPGNPAVALTGNADLSPSAIAAIERQYGLNQPLPVQYVDWLHQIVTGHLGASPVTGLAITSELATAFPITVELTVLAMLVGIIIGVPAGIVAAVRRGKAADYVGNAVALFGLSIPSFWFGILLILIFAVKLHVLPASSYVSFLSSPASNLSHMVMPAVVLGTGVAAVLMRQMRSAMLEALRADYVRTARAKGLPELSVVLKHALRNSLVTVATVIGLQIGVLLSGVAVTESVFGLSGVGNLTISAVFQRDYPTIQAVALITAAAVIAINFAMDFVYAFLSPRVRVEGDAQ